MQVFTIHHPTHGTARCDERGWPEFRAAGWSRELEPHPAPAPETEPREDEVARSRALAELCTMSGVKLALATILHDTHGITSRAALHLHVTDEGLLARLQADHRLRLGAGTIRSWAQQTYPDAHPVEASTHLTPEQ